MSVTGAAGFRHDRVHTRVGNSLSLKYEYVKGVPKGLLGPAGDPARVYRDHWSRWEYLSIFPLSWDALSAFPFMPFDI
jgi:hypothetical protein